MQRRLGVIQSRGLGDIVIALPIAHYYHRQGWQIHWPICREFIAQVQTHCPWVNWHAVTTDQGSFFYDQPWKILTDLGCEEIIPLYQALTNHDFHLHPCFQYTKFDQYKYIRAAVPFLEKWRLPEMVTRDHPAERALMQKLGIEPGDRICTLHLEGSDYRAQFDRSWVPPEYRIIEVREGLAESVFDWLGVLEASEILVCVDSVMANLVDQWGITGGDLYFLPRSHIGLTPTLNLPWQWLERGR